MLQRSPRELLRAVDRGGALVPNGGQFHKRRLGDTGVMLVEEPLRSLFVPQRIKVCHQRNEHSDLLFLAELMESGKPTPVVWRTYSLAQVPDAISYFGEGHAEGKVVITV